MYAKVFASIYDSSLADDFQTRHIFMDLLVLADMDGVVDMTHEAISRRTNVPIDIIRQAICKLCKPDVNSRSVNSDGRRLEPLDPGRNWGWQIVNFKAYHSLKTESARRAYMRNYMRKRREQRAASKQHVNTCKPNVKNVKHIDIDVDIDIDNNLPADEQRGGSATAELPKPSEQPKPPKKPKREKPEMKPKRTDPHAEAFKAAFDSEYPQPYAWATADFVQLAKWRKAYPAVTPDEFVQAARDAWAKGQYCPKAAMSIRALCAGWAQICAVLSAQDKADRQPTDEELMREIEEATRKAAENDRARSKRGPVAYSQAVARVEA